MTDGQPLLEAGVGEDQIINMADDNNGDGAPPAQPDGTSSKDGWLPPAKFGGTSAEDAQLWWHSFTLFKTFKK